MNALTQIDAPSEKRSDPLGAQRPSAIRRTLAALLRYWRGPVVFALLLAAANWLGLFAITDGRLFDFATINQPGRAPTVIIVEQDAAGAEAALLLENGLAERGIERLGYLGEDPLAGSDAVRPLPVIVAQDVSELRYNDRWEFAEQPAPGATTERAARAMAPSHLGLQRQQVTRLNGLEEPIPVFETALAGAAPDSATFLVPLSRDQSIPVIEAEQVTTGEISRDELTGFVALIATKDQLAGSLHTALTPDRPDTSEASFRAHATDALRSDSAVMPLADWRAALLIVTAVALLAFLLRRADAKALAWWVLAAWCVAVAGSGWLLLTYFQTWLPLTALALVAPLVVFERVIGSERLKDRELRRIAARATGANASDHAIVDDAIWDRSLSETAQSASVERSLLFERQPDGSVKCVAAYNASADDLVAPQRKLARLLARVERDNIAHPADDLVPGWGGNPVMVPILGEDQSLFLVMSGGSEDGLGQPVDGTEEMLGGIRSLARFRRVRQKAGSRSERRKPAETELGQTVASLIHESEQVRAGFDAMGTAIATFALVGSPIFANAAMRDLYLKAGIDPASAWASDVLRAMTDLEDEQIDAMMRELLLDGSEMRLPWQRSGRSNLMLQVATRRHGRRSSDRVIVLEAIDVREVNRDAQMRQAVARFIDLQLRNDLGAVLLGTNLASDERLDRAQVQAVVADINKTAHRASDRLRRVRTLVHGEAKDLVQACYPVNPSAIVADAVERAGHLAEDLGVNIACDTSEMGGFALAEPKALSDMLVAMLRVVIADTARGQSVTISSEETETDTQIRISGGFGIGFDRLLWLLSDEGSEDTGDYRAVSEGMALAVGWHCRVSYWGSETSGFGFNIALQKVG